VTRLLHIGDVHLRARSRAKENQRFARIMRRVMRSYAGADKPILVFTGDITDNGSEAEYAHALEILAPVRAAGFEMLITPGNHDVGPLGNTFSTSRQNNFQRHLLGDLLGIRAAKTTQDKMHELFPFMHECGDCHLIGLDSAHAEGHLANGTLGDRQREALDRLLIATTKPVVVLLHHHPFVRGRAMALTDRDALMTSLRGRVCALLFGHKHVAEIWRDDERWGIPLIVAAGKTSKPRRGDKKYELCEITVGGGAPTAKTIAFHLRFGRASES